MSNQRPREAGQFRIFGHRGAPRRRTENSIDSVRLAIDAGADGCEVDLRRLSDGTVVLFHDDRLRDSDIEAYDVAKFRTSAPDPAEAVDLRPFTDRARLILEVKRRGWEEQLLETVDGWRDIVVSSFDHRVIARLAELGATFDLGIILSGYLVHGAKYAASIGATWFFPHVSLVDPDMVAEFSSAGMRVVPWTSNREDDWDRLNVWGAYGVITDFPEEAVAWRKGKRGVL